jgi:hypothetical protein
VKAFFRNASPLAVVLPAVVPYIQQQLTHLELFHDLDGGASPHHPIVVGGTMVGRNMPALYPFNGKIHVKDPWILSLLPPPYLPSDNCHDQLDDCAPEDSLLTMSTVASTTGSSFSTS